jgi:hypothetical protein
MRCEGGAVCMDIGEGTGVVFAFNCSITLMRIWNTVAAMRSLTVARRPWRLGSSDVSRSPSHLAKSPPLVTPKMDLDPSNILM